MEMLIEKLKKFPSSDSNSLVHQDHKKKHKHKFHRRCAKALVDRVLVDRVLVDRVLVDEVCKCCETSGPCDIGITFPPGSVLHGTITVTVLECTPAICEPLQPIEFDVMLLIQKDFTVTEPNGKKIPLAFTFHRRCRHIFSPIFELDCIDPKHVQCLVFEIKEVCADIDFICANAAFDGHATISERLDVVLLLKLVVKEELDIK